MRKFKVINDNFCHKIGTILNYNDVSVYMKVYGGMQWDGTVKHLNEKMNLKIEEMFKPNGVKMNYFEIPERKRKYVYPDGTYYELLEVLALAVSSLGTHRLKLSDGTHIIVPTGWIAIELDIDNWSY